MLRFIVCMCMWSVVLSSEWYWPESQRILENTKSMETISKTYVINLKSRPEKLQNFRRQYPYDMKHVTIFEGIDGKTLDITQPNVSRHIRAMVGFEKHWNPGVLGCSLSHMAVWNLIASDKALSNDDRVMVFEDDPYFSKDFRRVWTSAAKELPKDADHVFVGGRFRPEYVPPKQSRHMECTMRDFKKVGQYVYTTPKGVFCFRTAVAYMLTKRGARRFLGAVEQHNGIRRGVDHFMMDHIKLQPKEEPTWSYNILPMPIYQKKDEITDIRQASNTWSVDKSGLDVLETLLREKKKPILWMGTDNIDNIPAYMFESWHNFTKGYQVRIYEEEQADTYVKLHCQGVWKLYSALKKYRTQPFRFDIWRTCALYTEGGFYMDIKTMLRQPLKSFVRPMVTTMTRGQRGGLAIGFMGGPAKQAIFAKFALEAKDHGPDLPHYHFYTVLMSDIAKRFSDIVYLNEDCSNYAGCVPDRHGLCCRIFDDNQQLMALMRDPTYPWRSSNGGLKHVVNLGNFYTLRETHPSALVEVGALAPEQIVNGRRTWVTMTTLPERLSNPWFAKTLNRTITMCSRLGATLLLQVPPHTRHSSRPYMVPQYILNLQSAAFQVSRVNVDEGPITKILPALRDPRIKDDDTIVVCDDDIVYRENVFKWLSDSVKKHPNAVSCTCSRRIAGFKGFAFQKRVFKELANIRQPPSCFRIDDDVIREFARHRNIGRVAVPYNNDTWWTCSMYRGQTDTHPRWPELAHDDRTPMQDKCIREFQQELANQYTNG